jgi:GNAT superfamily N-acetyltransferase
VPTVRPAAPHELPAVGALLAAAFTDDPVWSWLAGRPAAWDERATAWFTAEARSHHRGPGEVLVDHELRGAALWSPPKRWRPSNLEGARLAVPSIRLFGRNTPRALRFLLAMEAEHPRDPGHWYLAVLGTHPDHQGRGVGAALVEAVTERCDQEGLPSYLESSKEANVAFYARLGFVAREPLELLGGPRVWPMWREPKE